jgi:hypothetical protein
VTKDTATALLGVGMPFAWWGAVVAVSFLETPLKFRAPGITVPQALGIGRLVFRALNYLEAGLALAVVLGLSTAETAPSPASWFLCVAVCLILLVQAAFLRPTLDRRATALAAGEPFPPSRAHVLYVGGEVVKLVALPALAVSVATMLP